MDSNALEKTNSHKFLKLRFNLEKPAISLRKLLKQELLLVVNLYRQSLNLQSNNNLLDTFIDRQLILLPLEHQRSLLPLNDLYRSIPLCYSCPLGLILARQLQISPQKVVENLGILLARHNGVDREKSSLPLYLMVDSGWLNFYVTERAVASWLERSLWLFKTQIKDGNSNSILRISDRQETSDLFRVQYIHARCCSLLRLGARERLIALSNGDSYIGWQLTQPQSISWLDSEHHLWFDRRSEYNLLRQLLIVTDARTASDRNIWLKLALDLSQTTAIFLADCRFLGEIKEQYPQKAIARLGLIAMAQYWLQKILVEKLNITAPTTL